MSPLHPALFAADPDARLAQDRVPIEARMAMLTRLAEIGMGIAEDAGRMSRALAESGEAGANMPDPALAYSRAARAVRLTIALQSRLMKDLTDLDRAGHIVELSRARKRRDQAHRLIEQAIEAEHDDDHEIEQLSSEAWERLSETDDADIAGLAFDEVVARICKDLGLLLDQSALAGATERAADPISPTFPTPAHPPDEGGGGDPNACFETRPYVRSSA